VRIIWRDGRAARLIEYDTFYTDVIVRRWEKLTGKRSTLAATGQAFEDVANEGLAATGEK